jgi:hypothetical protein
MSTPTCFGQQTSEALDASEVSQTLKNDDFCPIYQQGVDYLHKYRENQMHSQQTKHAKMTFSKHLHGNC